MGVVGELLARMAITQTGSNDLGSVEFDVTVEQRIPIADGTTAGKADILFVDERTVASASNDDIDLAGALSDVFGDTVAAAELVAVLIINKPKTGAANTTDLTIGAAGTNPVTGFLGGTSPTIGPIKPGGVVLLASSDAAGLGAVTAGSADVLRVANSSGAPATYQIAILARSA